MQNLHFNLSERSFLKTDDLPRNRLEGAGFLFYQVPVDESTNEYVDEAGYTVEKDQDSGSIVLKKDGQTCASSELPTTDANGMLQLPEEMPNGRYWMVESVTPNKGETKYEDNLSLYMVDVEDEILFLYEKDPLKNTWKSLADRHIVNHPQKGGVTV